ncbi:MAG: hypothetical protein ACOX4U_02440 [Anaerovoracaceae bacterium]
MGRISDDGMVLSRPSDKSSNFVFFFLLHLRQICPFSIIPIVYGLKPD